jgi:hypothetical protein
MADQEPRLSSPVFLGEVRDAEDLIAKIHSIELPTPLVTGQRERAEMDAIRELRRAVDETVTIKTVYTTIA